MTLKTITVERDVQARARQDATAQRAEFLSRGTLVINLLSSPGAGKTSLLEATARHWQGRRRMAVLVGDIATDRDACRLAPLVPVVQLTTGGACHLDLSLVQRGLDRLELPDCEFLFIENVGNLVCPASHDLAEHLRVIVLSTTEGDDKPGKYPKAFRTSQVMVISKVDLLPYVPFAVESAVADAKIIQPDIESVPVCARDGRGIAAWCDILESARNELLATGHARFIRR